MLYSKFFRATLALVIVIMNLVSVAIIGHDLVTSVTEPNPVWGAFMPFFIGFAILASLMFISILRE